MNQEPVKILLSEAASRHLTATGESVFIVAAKASHPDDPKRWILYLVPTDINAANAACRVATGRSKEGKRGTAQSPPDRSSCEIDTNPTNNQ